MNSSNYSNESTDQDFVPGNADSSDIDYSTGELNSKEEHETIKLGD